MNLKQIENKKNKLVKVIFKEHDQRYPMIGKIVDLKDSEELKRKDMVRFVNQSRIDVWKDEEPLAALTRIYVVTDFTQVILM